MPQLKELILAPSSEKPIVERIKLKRQLLQAGNAEHESIRTALIIGGGGMRGVFSTGITAKLEQLGYSSVFDSAIGISAGACAVAYYLAGQANVGPSVYYDDLANRKFINLLRRDNVMDINVLEDVFRSVKPLNQEKARASRTDMYMGLTEKGTGKGVYFNIRRHSEIDIVTLLMASSAIPGVVKQRDPIAGKYYVDGTVGCHTPIDYAINELGATDILVVLNYPPFANNFALPMSAKLMSYIGMRSHSQALRDAHASKYSNHNFNGHSAYPEHINIGILCPDKNYVSSLSTNSASLHRLADYAQGKVAEIF